MENEAEIALVELVIAGMALLAILAVAIVGFVLIYQSKLARQKLDLQRMELDHHRNLLQVTLRTQEQEREQFAANLHDEVGAQLSLAKLTLSSAPNTADGSREPRVQQTLGIMDQLATSIRNIGHNLYPPSLSKLGLEAALQELIGKAGDQPAIELQANPSFPRLGEEVELHSYRIVQEAISNALKHANANSISIQLAMHPTGMQLTVQDDGRGFDTDQVAHSGMACSACKSVPR